MELHLLHQSPLILLCACSEALASAKSEDELKPQLRLDGPIISDRDYGRVSLSDSSESTILKLVFGSSVDKDFRTLDGLQKIFQISCLLDTSSVTLVQLFVEGLGVDFLNESLAIKRSWQSSIFLGTEVINRSNIIATFLPLNGKVFVILVSSEVFVTALGDLDGAYSSNSCDNKVESHLIL